MNAECRIQQHETQRAESGTSTTSSSWSQSSTPQLLKPLPPPGVSAYCPPMLWDQPPHLNLSIAPEASVAFTLSAHRVDCYNLYLLFLFLTAMYFHLTPTLLMTHLSHNCVLLSHNYSSLDSHLSQPCTFSHLLHHDSQLSYLRNIYIDQVTHCKYAT